MTPGEVQRWAVSPVYDDDGVPATFECPVSKGTWVKYTDHLADKAAALAAKDVELAEYKKFVPIMSEATNKLRIRAERAEAALARVGALVGKWRDDFIDCGTLDQYDCANEVRAAIKGYEE